MPLDVAAREIIGMAMQYGEVDIDRAFRILKNSTPFSRMSYSEFIELIKYMARNQVIELDGSKIRLGGKFYKIWRFDRSETRKFLSKSFTEFFSFISNNSEFIVKSGDECIGTLDASYVYRYVRVGDKIRLAGRLWKVVGVDENLGQIEVIPVSEGEGEIPVWRGEVGRREYILAEELSKVINELASNSLSIPRSLRISPRALEIIREFISRYRKLGIPVPSTDKIIVERYGDYYIFTVLLGERISETIALILLHLVARRKGLHVDARASAIGFAIKSFDVNALDMLLSIEPSEVETLARNVVSKFPQYYLSLIHI